MTVLRIAPGFTLPIEAATESFSIVGRRGAGKSTTGVVMAEEMLDAGVPIVVVDPKDEWWGLRVSKDGKSEGYPIYVCGGAKADLPLMPEAGALIADVVVDRCVSMILSVRHLSKKSQRRFVGDFCDRIYDRKASPDLRTALHIFIDEADAFVPQRLMPGSEQCFGAVDTLVRRGRSSGLTATLISQRPQVINKDVLSQTEVLVSHQLTGPQDRKALDAWIQANDPDDSREEFMASLASLERGTAWFWSPGFLGVFRKVAVRDRKTYDSSSTPRPGVKVVKPRKFAAVDIKNLSADIAALVAKVEADDPKKLQVKVRALEAEIKKLKSAGAPVSDAAAAAIEERARRKAERSWVDERRAMERRVVQLEKALRRINELSVVEDGPTLPPAAAPGPASPEKKPVRPSPPAAARSPVQESGADTPIGRGGLYRIMVALAQRPQGLTPRQIGVRAHLSSKGGTFSTYLSKARVNGWIEGDTHSGIRITDAGLGALGAFDPLPAGPDLLEYWIQKLGGGAARILRVLADRYPEALSKPEIGDLAEISHQGGTFSTYLSKLRTLELIEGRSEIRASAEFFE